MDDTITVSVALLRSLLGSTGLSRLRLGRSLLLLSLTSASLTRSSNVVGVNVNGEILKSITVDDALGRVSLGEFDGLGVVFGEVVDDTLADGRNVEDAVEEISGPEGVELGLGDGVAETADGVEAAADLEGARADDGLGGGVVTSPVASPLILGSAVLVGVIATEQHACLVGVDNTIIPTNRRSSRPVTKVLLLELRLISPSEEMILCMLS